MNEIIFSLYGILLVISIYTLIMQYKKIKIINFSICFQTSFILYYILIPIISHIFIEFFPNQLTGFLDRINKANNDDITYAFFYTLAGYWLIFLISNNKKILVKSTNLTTKENIKLNAINKNVITFNKDRIEKKSYRLAYVLGVITLIVGLFGEFTIANNLGGFLNAISMGDELRAFGNDLSKYIPKDKLFTIILMVSSLASTYFFVYAFRLSKNLSVFFLLFVSILASIYYLIFNAGRLGIILFILTFFIDIAFRKFKHPFIFIFIFSTFILFLLGLLDDLFFYLSYGYVKKKENSSGIQDIINEFAFPYLNLLNINHINETLGLRWGKDYFTWVINIVPTSILNIFGLSKVTPGYELITEYYSGKNADGGIPTDFLTLGMREFGFIGIILNSFVVSIICKYLDGIIYKIHSKHFYFLTLRITSLMFIIVPYADLDSFIRNRYDMIILLLFAIIIRRMKMNIMKVSVY